ncbi:MAG: hypothetical protein R3B99_25040 [Polyangiales bacterium]
MLQRLVVRPNEKLTEVPALHWISEPRDAPPRGLSADNRLSEAASHVGIDIPGLT